MDVPAVRGVVPAQSTGTASESRRDSATAVAADAGLRVSAAAPTQAVAAWLDVVGRGDPTLTAITRVAAFVAGTRCAAVHFIDEHAQHRIAAEGVDLDDVPRAASMCVRAMEEQAQISTTDATRDPRFAGSPYVTGPSPVRTYAASPLYDNGVPIGTLCVFDETATVLSARQLSLLQDLSATIVAHLDLRRAAGHLAHHATHDPLTGLPNRSLLFDRLQQALNRRQRRPGVPVLVMVDLDDFKEINDRWGHASGDSLLCSVAQRLVAAVRPEDTVCRLAGDEFVVLIEQVADAGLEVSRLPAVLRLRAAFAAPFDLLGEWVVVGASLGAAAAGSVASAAALLHEADLAMYAEKQLRHAGQVPSAG